ncbi:MAG TPA: hypothetical protein VMG62_02820 [Solirubrobacteraceae bacterium]|nr:hypothetical protein [Solirubrobacteraceae bacterium]
MTQLSRPFQILLIVSALFAAVWFVALRNHSSAPGASESTPVAPGRATNPAQATRVYHGPVPGLHGLTGAVAKAHGAVAQSQTDAKRFEHAQPAGASSSSSSSSSSTITSASGSANHSAGAAGSATASASHAQSATRPGGSAPAARAPVASGPAMQPTVERELAQHRVVLILFWNPKGAEDRAVRAQLPKVAHNLAARVAIHYSLPHAVTQYGKFTNAIQVNQTPTVLLVNPRGQASTLTGFLDAYAIEQAVAQSRAA